MILMSLPRLVVVLSLALFACITSASDLADGIYIADIEGINSPDAHPSLYSETFDVLGEIRRLEIKNVGSDIQVMTTVLYGNTLYHVTGFARKIDQSFDGTTRYNMFSEIEVTAGVEEGPRACRLPVNFELRSLPDQIYVSAETPNLHLKKGVVDLDCETFVGSTIRDYSVPFVKPTDHYPRWVNTWTRATIETGCARFGLVPAHNSSIGICASGEVRPTTGSRFGRIEYDFGVWGTSPGLNGGTIIEAFDYDVNSPALNYCYKDDQKQDHDDTDYVVAYLCTL